MLYPANNPEVQKRTKQNEGAMVMINKLRIKQETEKNTSTNTYLSTKTPEASKYFIKNNRNFTFSAHIHKNPLKKRIDHVHTSSSMYDYIIR